MTKIKQLITDTSSGSESKFETDTIKSGSYQRAEGYAAQLEVQSKTVPSSTSYSILVRDSNTGKIGSVITTVSTARRNHVRQLNKRTSTWIKR